MNPSARMATLGRPVREVLIPQVDTLLGLSVQPFSDRAHPPCSNDEAAHPRHRCAGRRVSPSPQRLMEQRKLELIQQTAAVPDLASAPQPIRDADARQQRLITQLLPERV